MTSGMTEIFVHDLVLEMYVGVLDSEQHARQRVILNINAFFKRPNNKLYSDEIETTLSYVDLITIAEKTAGSRHFNLVETLAEEIASECLNIKGLDKVIIRIKKPDIINNVSSVGIAIERNKNQPEP